MIKKMNTFLNNKSITIFYIFLFLQPILDLLISFSNHFSISPIYIYIIRMTSLVFALYYMLFIKKKNIKYVLLLALYYIIFILINLITKPTGNIIYEVQAVTKVIYFPIILVFALELFKNNKFDLKKLHTILIIYVVFIFVPNLLNIGFDSYKFDKIGSIGFFFSANVVGNIISILAPISIGYLINNKKLLQLLILSIMYVYVLFTMGTKAPLLVFFIIVLYYIILGLLKILKKKKYKYIIVALIGITILTILMIKLLPETSFYKNLIIHARNKDIHSIKDLLDIRKLDEYIFSARLKTFKESLSIYMNSSIIKKLFGIGYVINGVIIKTSEMDFLVSFIHHGIIGLILINYKFIKTLFILIKKYLKNLKHNIFDIEKNSLIISIITIILNVLLVGHALDIPSVSIFVATIVAVTFRKKERKNEK